jgi:hypothetical protein
VAVGGLVPDALSQLKQDWSSDVALADTRTCWRCLGGVQLWSCGRAVICNLPKLSTICFYNTNPTVQQLGLGHFGNVLWDYDIDIRSFALVTVLDKGRSAYNTIFHLFKATMEGDKEFVQYFLRHGPFCSLWTLWGVFDTACTASGAAMA